MPKTLAIEIIGKVQGVFYRVSAKQQADKLGLTGFVQNQPEGSVYIEVQGSQKSLDTFTSWCQQGSKYASVNKISSHPIKKLSQPVSSSFEIL